MRSNINLKARIQRHSKLLKENFKKSNPLKTFFQKINKNIIIFLVIFVFPIYPIFASFLYDSKNWNFFRIDIDESSIIESYDNIEINLEDKVLTYQDSFLSVQTLSNNNDRDLTWFNEIIEYEVLPWDSFSSISKKFQVNINSILWANNFDSKKILKPWEKIKIPPVNWIIHEIKKWETIESLAKKYNIDKEKIIAQNNLTWSNNLEIWSTIIIPDAVKIEQKPIYKKPNTTKYVSNDKYYFASWNSSQYINTSWVYKLIKRTPKRNFVWWNCTWFVAQYKDVDWSWNAKDWLKNAKAKWHPTWKTPWIGAIVVFHGRWYNPWYWHVWIVIDITKDHIIVKDMNYRKLNEVTTRKVLKTDKAIKWYIYVD